MYITNLYDRLGNKYLGFDISEDSISYYLNILKEHLGDNFESYHLKKMERDNGKYHITVLNVKEYNSLLKNDINLDYLYTTNYSLQFKGIGGIVDNNNEVYYIVVSCAELNRERVYLGLDIKDLHITLAFKNKDIFNKRKNLTNIYDNNNN